MLSSRSLKNTHSLQFNSIQQLSCLKHDFYISRMRWRIPTARLMILSRDFKFTQAHTVAVVIVIVMWRDCFHFRGAAVSAANAFESRSIDLLTLWCDDTRSIPLGTVPLPSIHLNFWVNGIPFSICCCCCLSFAFSISTTAWPRRLTWPAVGFGGCQLKSVQIGSLGESSTKSVDQTERE